MNKSELSIKEKIQYVDECRDKIHRSATLLTGFLQQLEIDDQEDTIFKIKREIRTIIAELNKMVGFCDKKIQDIITSLSEVGSQFTAMKSAKWMIDKQRIINYWASKTTSIPLDYSKSPFSISGGFEINWKILKAFLKGKFERK